MPWWTGLTIVAMTIIRCSVAALRAGELRFIGFSLHTPINIFLLLPMKVYALCTLSNSDWLSRRPAGLLDGNGTNGKLLCPAPTTDKPKEIGRCSTDLPGQIRAPSGQSCLTNSQANWSRRSRNSAQ
ncbi:hypothetical protein ACVWYI_007984 [Bradyrhizobium sp. LB13.1]